jgi:hypothetical protein
MLRRSNWSPGRAIMTSGLRARRLLWIFLIAFAFTPVFAVDIPAMRDYPNHLAIMAVIAQDGGPKANTFYEVHWHLTTNLTMELLVPPLGRLVGVETAAKASC